MSNSWKLGKGKGMEEAEASLIRVVFCSSKTAPTCTRANVHGIEIVGVGRGMLATTSEVLLLAGKVISTGRSSVLWKSKIGTESKIEGEDLFPNRANGNPVLNVISLSVLFDL